jgi:DNA-directed RNA polymerase omega subunit
MLVHVTTKRVRQLIEGSPRLVKSTNENVVTALREVSAGKVFVKEDQENTE